MQQEALARARLRTELTAALAENAFGLAFQPQVEGFTGRLVGMECLIRWGERSPAEFIPVAEDCGVIRNCNKP